MTEFLSTDGGRLAYEVTGEGPLVVLAHGMGDNRAAYRETAALLVAAGYRVASTDLRGHGESSTGWASYTRTDVAGDLLGLIRHLGGPAVIVGHSFAGGAATIAAAQEPELVDAIVEISPFTRAQKIDFGALGSNPRYRKGMLLLLGTGILRSTGLWKRYLDHAYPGTRPAGHAAHLAALDADLGRPGRMAVVAKMGMSAPTDAGARLGDVRCPALIVEGDLDCDWADPAAEGAAIVAELPAGRGRLVTIEGAGHYAHAQFPAETAAAIVSFLKETARA
ncbi:MULTISPECIES: alpha/beta fold hydrolase [unclassified Streptomyces]|uniref:alpha/beta fold hydrolase n=1 Tax=unclassified Streptomyces TaxID=2593676 RepID=UPI002030B7BA|nr:MULTISPECIES: alpha/beta hydrolase [unclassified Streptomyces]MCM1970592.1 alpha/beta hydrolase [Streptomyces sp. G1]MCX5130401.1 alpha/beta hydrolase [Streptomyces sp. NBC_00347]MCX5301782.1 alpha/beta hydrolase [Streptomyces sp. NBC_00193]